MNDHTIGVDISKAHLDAFRSRDGSERRFTNDAEGHGRLLLWIGDGGDRVVFEATGAYHRDFEDALGRAGVCFSKVNPGRARDFAKGSGLLAKTDRLDARMLAAMGRAVPLRRAEAPTMESRELGELRVARAGLVRDRVAALNRGEWQRGGLLRRQRDERLSEIEKHIKELDARIEELVEADEALAERRGILMSIPGIGRTTAVALLVEMPELGALRGREAASLAGLAPVARESGTWRGRRFVQGGRAAVRRALYMAAVACLRWNPDLERVWRRLREAGKPSKVALVAVMRKLLVLANALLASGRHWTPTPVR